MYQQIRVAMPPGVQPGQIIQVRAPAGQIVQVRAPPGVPPGGTFVVNVPAAAPVAQVQMMPMQQQRQTMAPSMAPPPQAMRQTTTAAPQYRPPQQPYRPPARVAPVTTQPQRQKMTDTKAIEHAPYVVPCSEGGCYKCTCCACYTCVCCFCCTKQVAAVRQGTVGIIEKFGKFSRAAEAGEVLLEAPCGPFVTFEAIAKTMNLRTQQQVVDVNTKTKDNVFVNFEVAVFYKIPDVASAQLACYKLENFGAQLNSYVEDTLRTVIAKVKVDDVFTMSQELAESIKEAVVPRMRTYGYEILDTLVIGIEPEARVKQSMNEINYQKRMKAAQVNAAEAQKAIEIKLAEARAEAKHLSGVGLARMRTAMVDGFAECVGTLNVSDDPKFSSDATELLLTTQYMDLLEAVAEDTRSGRSQYTQVFLPTDMKAVDEMRQRITIFQGAFR